MAADGLDIGTPLQTACATAADKLFETGVRGLTRMSLQIAQREREAIAILDLHGELVLGDDHLVILRHLLVLLDSRRHKVILNLKGVSTVDAAGLATLTFCARLFHDIGGRVVFLNPRHQDRSIADILEPDTVLETYHEEIDAVKSFFPDRVVPRYDILEFVRKRKGLCR